MNFYPYPTIGAGKSKDFLLKAGKKGHEKAPPMRAIRMGGAQRLSSVEQVAALPPATNTFL